MRKVMLFFIIISFISFLLLLSPSYYFYFLYFERLIVMINFNLLQATCFGGCSRSFRSYILFTLYYC
jgi:hypothetical protein